MNKYLLFFALISHNVLTAGDHTLTGNVRLDLAGAFAQDSVPADKGSAVDVHDPRYKNPFYTGLYSLLVPGAGQYATERYTKAAIFLVAEVAIITTIVVYNNKGNTQTDNFQNYADAHFSAVRYANWIMKYGAADYGPTGATIPINPNTSLPPWNRVNFEDIRNWERGTHKEGFSHTLPDYGEQQYYELIGKYVQFKYGWDTYPLDAQGVPVSDGGNYNSLIPQQMKDYDAMRGKANDYYNIASAAAACVVVNHILSALDAYLSTKNDNHKITSTVGMKMRQVGGSVDLHPELAMKISF